MVGGGRMGQPTGGMFTTLLNKTAILGTVVRVAAAAPRALLRRGGAMTRYVGLLAGEARGEY